MDVNHDEVRRQLVESKHDQAAALPRFREALKRLFDREASAPADAKAALLGVPGRRALLTVGGTAVVGSAVLVGCSKSAKKQLTQTGTTATTSASTTTTAPGSPEDDVVLLRTAQSIEALAVYTYGQAIDSGLLTTPAVSDAAKLFRDQHQQHADLLASTTTSLGEQPYGEPNLWLKVEVVQPALDALTDEDSVLKLAATVEDTAAQTYTKAGGTFTTPALRAAALSIGATEARHLTVIYAAQGGNPVPLPLMPTRNAAPEDSYIGPDGPVETPEPPTTTTTAAS